MRNRRTDAAWGKEAAWKSPRVIGTALTGAESSYDSTPPELRTVLFCWLPHCTPATGDFLGPTDSITAASREETESSGVFFTFAPQRQNCGFLHGHLAALARCPCR